MKEQYLKKVKKELNLPRKAKREVLRDLNEIFASASEHGETEQQVIERLGTPKEFADSTAEQFGIDNTALKNRREIISSVAALIVAIAAFAIYAAAQVEKGPENAIGRADAVTTIQIAGTIGFDASQILFTLGLAAAFIAVLLIIRLIRRNRRQ